MRAAIVSAIVCVLGCSGSSFEQAGPGESDTGRGDDTGSGDSAGETSETGIDDTGLALDTASDSPIADSGTGDTGPSFDGPGPPIEAGGGDAVSCSSLPSGATEIYVDKRFAGVPTGTIGCPFITIGDAMKVPGPWVGTRTVHVAGSTVALWYTETTSVFVSKNMVLLGDGLDKVTISAPSTAAGAAVVVDGGGTLDGFSISSSLGDGILTQNALPAPIVKNVKVNAAKTNGITVGGSAEIGPNAHFDKNGFYGLGSKGDGTVHIIAPNASFDGNSASGISLDGGATLKFDGGSASNNNANGVRLNGSSGGVAVVHTVTSLIANNNKGQGIGVFNGHSLKLRSSTTLGNYSGVVFIYMGSNTLDLGVGGDKGGNTFGGATIHNTRAGLLLCKSKGPGTQPADGDTFGACAPTQSSVSMCDVSGSYFDVVYSPGISVSPGDPVTAGSCTMGL